VSGLATALPDPYLDPETGILRNKLGLKTKVALDDAEGDLTFAALLELLDHPPPPTGDLAELKAIHRHLFEDLYDYAAEELHQDDDLRQNPKRSSPPQPA
jgi:cell filamentation protein